MEHYSLAPDEVILYKGNVNFAKSKSETVRLLLTNLNLVFIITKEKLFRDDETRVERYPVEEIKIYNGIPQIKQKGSDVEAYLVSGEFFLKFPSMMEAIKFKNAVFDLLTGKNFAKRSAEKVKGASTLVEDATGINPINILKETVSNGKKVLNILGLTVNSTNTEETKNKQNSDKSENKSSFAKKAGKFLNLFSKTNDESTQPENKQLPQNNMSYDERIEAVKKLKDLLDSGIITQEEFDLKKKEILDL